MSATLHYEWIEERVLAGLRFVDAATGAQVSSAVALTAPDLRLIRKRSGDVVVLSADPAGGPSYPIDARGRTGEYARRRYMLHLPRDPDPNNAASAGSLFQPAPVPMFPGPRYPISGNLALVRVTVRRSTDNARIGGALVRLTPSLSAVPAARALTDIAGEALLVVPGVPLSGPGPGATVVAAFDAAAIVLVDPALATFTADAALDTARAADVSRIDGFADPDDIEARLGGAAPPSANVQISAGRMVFALLTWTP
jgi:hypothetical protein